MDYLRSLVIGVGGWVGTCRYLDYYEMLVVSISLVEFVLVRFFLSCLLVVFVLSS